MEGEGRSGWRHGTINVSPGPLERCRHSRGFPHASVKATDGRWRYLKCLASTSATARPGVSFDYRRGSSFTRPPSFPLSHGVRAHFHLFASRYASSPVKEGTVIIIRNGDPYAKIASERKTVKSRVCAFFSGCTLLFPVEKLHYRSFRINASFVGIIELFAKFYREEKSIRRMAGITTMYDSVDVSDTTAVR